jgi:hypothetical protein
VIIGECDGFLVAVQVKKEMFWICKDDPIDWGPFDHARSHVGWSAREPQRYWAEISVFTVSQKVARSSFLCAGRSNWLTIGSNQTDTPGGFLIWWWRTINSSRVSCLEILCWKFLDLRLAFLKSRPMNPHWNLGEKVDWESFQKSFRELVIN